MNPKRGVYALRHKATGKLYIGSTHNFARRRKEWWRRINNDRQDLPGSLWALTSIGREDWEFKILWGAATPVSSEELRHREAEAVTHIQAVRPDLLLNTFMAPIQRGDLAGLTINDRTLTVRGWAKEMNIPRTTIAARLQAGWLTEQAVGLAPPPVRDYINGARQSAIARAGTKVLDHNGQPMLLREVARVLGCNYDTISKRLADRRTKTGETQVTLAELKQGTEKYRKLKKGTPPPK